MHELMLAKHYLDLDQPERVLSELAKRENLGGEVMYWRLSGQALIQLGRHEEALAAVARGLELEPDNASLYFERASYHFLQDDLASAEQALSEALSIRPGYPLYLTFYANLLLKGERFTKAGELIARAEAATSEDIDVKHARLSYLCDRGDFQEAAALSRELLARHPDDAFSKNSLVGTLLNLGKLDEASRYARELAVSEPSTFNANRARDLREPVDSVNASRARTQNWLTRHSRYSNWVLARPRLALALLIFAILALSLIFGQLLIRYSSAALLGTPLLFVNSYNLRDRHQVRRDAVNDLETSQDRPASDSEEIGAPRSHFG